MASCKIIRRLLLLIVISGFSQFSQAWDGIGHRLSAEIALANLTESSQQTLRHILEQHPRYQQDFLASMPAYIERASEQRQLAWLLGQAAYWPDLARSLTAVQRQRYNHPTWHYIDGAWTRDTALNQGNVYLNRSAAPIQRGQRVTNHQPLEQINNVMTALDYNTQQLISNDTSSADKAIALCWFLHLTADIHQPLHSGSLFSAWLFTNGDRGGNLINTNQGNLHYRWDSALSELSIGDNLQRINRVIDPALRSLAQQSFSDWSVWLNESRDILRDQVYSNEIKQLILEGEQGKQSLPDIRLSTDYIQTMQNQSQLRIALAGLRIANWLDNHLPR